MEVNFILTQGTLFYFKSMLFEFERSYSFNALNKRMTNRFIITLPVNWMIVWQITSCYIKILLTGYNGIYYVHRWWDKTKQIYLQNLLALNRWSLDRDGKSSRFHSNWFIWLYELNWTKLWLLAIFTQIK